jgi:hypothetical protein
MDRNNSCDFCHDYAWSMFNVAPQAPVNPTRTIPAVPIAQPKPPVVNRERLTSGTQQEDGLDPLPLSFDHPTRVMLGVKRPEHDLRVGLERQGNRTPFAAWSIDVGLEA